ncbi:molecular chaperone SurA [Lysobacter oculi]|uniref:Chaperone SurA n=1 Tax=Solilutibacter oculi TaxID=2698682 RepID=A0A344J359_9GAMM|nr:peptidylprolyl isomerase [Lysobacter oculi]AXA83469.1 molecular chaperone SurA [Lysobacter oculi]
MMNPRALLLAAALAFTPVALQAQTQPVDRIAAVVNEDVILQSELDRAIANITAQYASNPGQLPPPEVLAKQVLERLVLTRLQVTRAQESGIRVTDQEIDQAVGNIAQQNNMTPDQLRAQVAKDGLSLADFRNTLRDEITIQRMKQSFAQSRIQVSEAEVNAAVAQQAGAGGGNQYHLAHLLVALPEGATAEQIATAQKKIDGIKGLIDRGEMDFAAAAVRYSDSPNALEGGDLGWRPESEIPPAFAQTVRTMQAGQIIGPIRGSSGFQLIRLVETRSGAAAPAQVTEYHVRHILVQGDDAASEAKLNTLRARALGGADFAELAKEESQDAQSKDKGGDIGWRTTDAFGPELGPQIAALKDGDITPPIKSQAGWHLIQVVGRRQGAAGSDQQRAAARETIGRRKLEDEYTRFLQEMRGDAYVDVRSESVIGVAPASNGG